MASIHPSFEYDIFISYRHNDNKYEGWVTEFVDNLRKELDATLKNPVSIYFDENPHDGLQETHVVDESLKKKLKCLIFIPILSQTYCDETSFAWQHEFLAFIKMAGMDKLGMNINLLNGNVASRILPIRIHDIDPEDQQEFEKATSSPLRGIDFIYKEAGVNRCLKTEDDKKDNLNNTSYRNQMNKVAHALKDLGMSIMQQSKEKSSVINTETAQEHTPKKIFIKKSMLIGLIGIILLLLLGDWSYNNYFSSSEIAVLGAISQEKSIAVLPFSNTKPDPNTNFLGFAIANQIIVDLDYNKKIIVRPAGSIRQYDQQIIDALIVADDLKVNYVLTGTYLIQAGIIRLNIELIEAKSKTMLWRDKIEVDYHNAFELQDIVAKKVVDGLQSKFSQNELNRINKNTPQNPLAYEFYLRGISYPLSIEGHKLAIKMLNKSIELDSTYAPTYSHLGLRTRFLAFFNLESPASSMLAENYYLKALSLNSDLLSAQADLAMLYVETGRTYKAVKLARRMAEINPNNAVAHFSLSYVYRFGGMLEEAVEEADKAIALDPKNPRFRQLGISYMYVENYNKAIETLELDKGSTYSLGYKSQISIKQGMNDQAMMYCDRIIDNKQSKLWVLVGKTYKAYLQDSIASARKSMIEIEKANISDSEAWYFWASNYGILGDRDASIRCLARAIDDGYFNYPYMLTDPFMDSVREDPEIQKLFARAKKKHEAFKEKYF